MFSGQRVLGSCTVLIWTSVLEAELEAKKGCCIHDKPVLLIQNYKMNTITSRYKDASAKAPVLISFSFGLPYQTGKAV